jgi:hypothetical protein
MPKGISDEITRLSYERLRAELQARGQDPDAIQPHEGFESGDSRQFLVRCGSCRLKIARFDARLFVYDDPKADWAGEIYITTESDDGPGMRKGSRSANPPGDPEMGHDRRWALVCPGKRCRMRYVVTQDRLSQAMIRAFRLSQHELLAGVDF